MTHRAGPARPFIAFLLLTLCGAGPLSAEPRDSHDPRPTLFIVGDSTVNNGTPGQMGWGQTLPLSFDLSRIRLENRARGGRSSRTFITQSLATDWLNHVQFSPPTLAC